VLASEMKYLNYNKKKKNNSIVTAAKVFSLATTIILIAGTAVIAPLALQSAEAVVICDPTNCPRAPVVVSGENIYIAWWTNNTENGNEEVMFRASTDGGATFSNKTNLSNTTDADSWRVEIAGEGDNVIVSWWETNQTNDTPVARVSNDGGETFGPLLMLAANGTISSTEEGAVTTAEEGQEELLPDVEQTPTEEEA
jgi:hypothetical protein